MKSGRLNKISFKTLVLSASAVTFIVLMIAIASISSLIASAELTDKFYQEGVHLTKNLAKNSVPPLLYDSPAGAENVLDTLVDIEYVSEVGIVTVAGKPLLKRRDNGHIDHPYPEVIPTRPFAVSETDVGWYFSALVITQEAVPEAGNDLLGLLSEQASPEVIGTVNLALSKEAIYTSRRNIFINNFIISSAVALLLLLLMYWVLSNLTRPLENLSKLMEQGRLGKYRENTDNRGPKEIFEMSRTFNNMIYAIRDREQNLSLTLDSIGDAVIATDVDGNITRMNPVAEALTGWVIADALGRPLSDVFRIIDAETRKAIVSPVHEALQANRVVETAEHTMLVSKDGNEYQIADSGAPIRDESGAVLGVILVFRDITEEYALQAALNENRQRLQSILDNTSAVINVKDREGRYLLVNRQFESLFNVSNDEIRGLMGDDVFPAELANKLRENDDRVLQTQTSLKSEDILPLGDGAHTYLTVKFPLFDDENAVNAICAISTDISERLKTEEALRRSQKMEAVGQLSGGIAHDFNNQLGVVVGYLDFLKTYTANDEKPRKWVNAATKATQRCIDLTRQLLAFSRRQVREKNVVDINEILVELEPMIARTVTPEVDVKYSLATGLWKTEIDAGEFQDAILNLVINARDAMPNGGKLQIVTSNVKLDDDFVLRTPGVIAGDYIQLVVGDSGSGITQETLEHIFEPFFTTKPAGKGTGLGMAMVYGFVKRYDGDIKVYSQPGVGTSMHLYLPRSSALDISPPARSHQTTELPTGNERVLIVDDEGELLMLADEYLAALGYRTQTASHAAQALQILQQDAGFDLLFSDVVMPGDMSGYELAQKATELKPALKVLLTSGFTAKTPTNASQARFSANLLDKPYRKESLAQRVRQVLDEVQADAVSQLEGDGENRQLAGCTVLVVDDEADMRDLFDIHLTRLGCTTVTAQNADEALMLYRQALRDNKPIDIVILDLNFPEGIGGEEIAQQIRALNSQAKIIVASGSTSGPEMTHFRDHGFDGALEKIFKQENIRQVLEQVLSSD